MDEEKVKRWLETPGEPGPQCLTPDEMAAAIEGRFTSPHLKTCPRCAAELKDLEPRKATTRIRLPAEAPRAKAGRRPAPASNPWIAAAAALLFAAALYLVYRQFTLESPPSDVAHRPEPPMTDQKAEKPKTEEGKAPDQNKGDEKKEKKKEEPGKEEPRVEPEKKPDEPMPEKKKSEEKKPEERETQLEEKPAKAEIAVALKSGRLSGLIEGKWIKAEKVTEDLPLRAEGRTRVDFAGASITLDGSSRFTLSKDALSLAEGGLTADVSAASPFTLVLGDTRISPAAKFGRVLLCAKPDRFLVEEGSAKSGDFVIGQGIEVDAKTMKPRKGRSLPPAARSRETLTWKLDIENQNATRGKLPEGKVVGRTLVSTKMADQQWYYGSIQFNAGGSIDLYTVKVTTAIRFRYFLKENAPLKFSVRNHTKDENFSADVDPVVGQWTTVTVFVRDIPVNTGGKKVTCEIGDKYGWFGWNVGKPGVPAEIQIDQFEVLEIER